MEINIDIILILYYTKIDNLNIYNYRIILGDFLYPKLASRSFVTVRKGCRYCKKPHPCESIGYCPTNGLIGGEENIYSIRKAVEKLKEQGVNISESLIKHYDRKKMISPVKTVGGHRRFDDDCLKKIAFIKKVQKYGFNLKEVQYYQDIDIIRDIKDIEDIFGPVKFYEEDFLVKKEIRNYTSTGDSSLYWWSDFGSGPGLQEKAQRRSCSSIVWGYVYKNCTYDKDKDTLKYRMYLFPEKPDEQELKIKKLLDFIHLYVFFLYSIDFDEEDIRGGTLDRFSLWVDDRYTDYNRIVRARIHIFTDLKPYHFNGPKDKGGVSIYYDFEIPDKEKGSYRDYFIPDNYDQSRDGMHRKFF